MPGTHPAPFLLARYPTPHRADGIVAHSPREPGRKIDPPRDQEWRIFNSYGTHGAYIPSPFPIITPPPIIHQQRIPISPFFLEDNLSIRKSAALTHTPRPLTTRTPNATTKSSILDTLNDLLSPRPTALRGWRRAWESLWSRLGML